MDLTKLEALIDEVNTELLTGERTPIHEMDADQLHAFISRQEKLYRACNQIQLAKHLRKFKVGIEFSEYTKQEDKKTKVANKNKKTVETKSGTKVQVPTLLGQDAFSAIISMKANYCNTCWKKKEECICPKPNGTN